MASVWERLDYAHDAIIEASAGTGKTYALVQIVLRLVCARGYDAKSILLVTFTEKAAGELKNRIREGLAAARALPPDFDEMTICTIHSFCRRLLSEYAFENGVPMTCDVSGGGAVAHRAVLEALRGEAFAARFGADLADALAEAGIASVGALVAEVEALLNTSSDRDRDAARANESRPVVAELLALAETRNRELKKDLSLMTFDDLVERASAVVCGGGTDDATRRRLIASVRARYRVALVDEFQDTDAKQWGMFRTLFSSGANAADGDRPGFLLAVGDPKQAIYSFRGADVAVYCAARDVLSCNDERGADGEPKWRQTLTETYRARRPLVDAFNTFFGEASGWFADGAAGAGIDYAPVAYPANGNAKFDGAASGLGAPVVLLESLPDHAVPSAYGGGAFGNKAKCLPVFAENAAREMRRLHDDFGLAYGKMCVLVETKADATVVRSILSARAIPYGQYKQVGLFDSAEAEGVLALFDFLAHPSGRGNRAALLLSPIFNVHPAHLVEGDWGQSPLPARTKEEDAAFDAFLDALQPHLRTCDWPRLFEAVMSADCTALVHPAGDPDAFNRRRAAVRQIFDTLLREAGGRARSVADLAAFLRAERDGDRAAGENGALYEKESAADRVQIMTMHASKGLEFPVVFLAYGFSKVAKSKGDAEGAQERRRLLYVALTRAEERLYLPWSRRAWSWTAEKPGRGKSAAPTVLHGQGLGSAGAALMATSPHGFLARAILAYFAGRQDAAFDPADESLQLRSSSPASSSRGAEEPPRVRSCKLSPPSGLSIPYLGDRRLRWESFSSLNAHGGAARPVAPTWAVEADPSATDDEAAPDPSATAPTLLPRTNTSGTVFHEVMEALCKLDDWNADETALTDLIRRTMERHALANRTRGDDSTERTLARMVRAALETELRIGGDAFRLRDVPKADRLAEIDFVRAWDGGALNGQIDLVVRRGGRVFILDWKTNTLPAYDAPRVAAAMDAAGYALQYKIYALAVADWLRRTGLDLAGVAYLFVRGGEAGGPCGVFARTVDAAALAAFRTDVAATGRARSPSEPQMVGTIAPNRPQRKETR